MAHVVPEQSQEHVVLFQVWGDVQSRIELQPHTQLIRSFWGEMQVGGLVHVEVTKLSVSDRAK